MKKVLLIAALLAGSLYAIGSTVYVDANSTGEAEPYDSWETASTTLGKAAVVAGSYGTVVLASGTYDETDALPDQALTLRAVASPTDSSAGTVTLAPVIYRSTVNNTDPDKYVLTMDKGTFKFNSTKNVFVDQAGSYGKSLCYRFTITGSETVFDASDFEFYMGYTAKNSTMRLTDGARGLCKCFWFANLQHGSGSTLIVDGDATFTSANFMKMARPNGSYGAGDVTLVVSNGTFNVGTEVLAGNAFSGNNQIVLAGETPVFSVKTTVTLTNSGLSFNVSEAPLAGYATTPLVLQALSLDDTSTISVTGLAALRQRLRLAATPSAKFTLIATSNKSSLTIPAAQLAALQTQVAAEGDFSIEANPAGATGQLVLTYAATKVETVRVTPDGTEDNSPIWPFATWAQAANSVKTASLAVTTNGTIEIASGTYDASEQGVFPESKVTVRAVASATDDAPGLVVLKDQPLQVTRVNTDPDIFNVTYAYGMFSFIADSNKHVFLDGKTSSCSYGVAGNCQITFTGADTMLTNKEAVCYLGYATSHATWRMTDRARGRIASCYIGDYTKGVDSTVIVEDGAWLKTDNWFYLGRAADRATLVVSNATFTTGKFQVGNLSTKSEVGTNNCIRLMGAAPRLEVVISNGENSKLYQNNRMDFDVSEAPLAGYEQAPFFGHGFTVESGFKITLSGVDKLAERLVAAEQNRLSLTLLQVADTTAFASQIAALKALDLPENFTIENDETTLKLVYHNPIGFIMILR